MPKISYSNPTRAMSSYRLKSMLLAKYMYSRPNPRTFLQLPASLLLKLMHFTNPRANHATVWAATVQILSRNPSSGGGTERLVLTSNIVYMFMHLWLHNNLFKVCE